MILIPISIRRILVAFPLVVAPAAMADDDPFAPAKPGTNKPGAEKPGAEKPKGAWGDEKDLRMPTDHKNQVTFGPAGCPLAVVGPSVVDLKSSKPLRDLDGTYEASGLRTLSATGKYFAGASKSPNQKDTTVIVWGTDT